MNYQIIDSTIGPLTLAANEDALTMLVFGSVVPEGAKNENNSILEEAKRQLQEYFAGKRTTFELPLKPKGSSFQEKVWQALMTIPYGETRAYLEIADQIGNPKACRAVGGANHNNPISIVIPCHRVIGKDQRLIGYGGGLPIKEFLLHLERNSQADTSSVLTQI
jgi:methylated-DNA-[protein]-cysteine S-methyltransferase